MKPILVTGLAWAAVVLASAGLRAQDDPFAPAAEPAANDRPAEPAPVVAPAANAPAPETSRAREPAAVRAVLETNPSTPLELIRAADTLALLDRPALARPLLAKALAAPLAPEAASQLLDKLTSTPLLRLASNEKLAPEGDQLATRILQLAKQHRDDPRRVAALVGDLSAADELVRGAAAWDLAHSGAAAALPLLEVLAGATQPVARRTAEQLLGELGSDAVGPLLAAIQSPQEPLRLAAIRVLPQLDPQAALDPIAALAIDPRASGAVRSAASDALRRLTGKPADRDELIDRLRGRVDRLLAASRDDWGGAESAVELFHWDEARRAAVAKTYRRADADMVAAVHLAEVLTLVAPNDAAARRRYLVAALSAAKYRDGLDHPLAAAPAGTSLAALADALRFAMVEGHRAAATAAAELLGRIEPGAASSAILATLVDATRQPDRRLRFAAATALARVAPRASFAGASRAAEALAQLAGTSGARRALVGFRRSTLAQQVAGLLETAGYQADAATDGRELIRLAVASPDYELIVLDVALDRPGLFDLLVQLRKDPRTADVPVALVAPVEELERYRTVADQALLAREFPLPTAPAAASALAARTAALAGRAFVPLAERQRQAAGAVEAIGRLLESPPPSLDAQSFVPALERALAVPHLSAPAALALGRIGSPRSQQALVEQAGQMDRPAAARRAATVALERSVARHGVLLTQGEIARQYDRYNASAQADRETQKALSSVLDALEQKRSP